jgi:hypothetical protein
MLYFGTEWRRIVNIMIPSPYSRENVGRYGLEAGSEYNDWEEPVATRRNGVVESVVSWVINVRFKYAKPE